MASRRSCGRLEPDGSPPPSTSCPRGRVWRARTMSPVSRPCITRPTTAGVYGSTDKRKVRETCRSYWRAADALAAHPECSFRLPPCQKDRGKCLQGKGSAQTRKARALCCHARRYDVLYPLFFLLSLLFHPLCLYLPGRAVNTPHLPNPPPPTHPSAPDEGRSSVVRVLVLAGADTKATDNSGNVPGARFQALSYLRYDTRHGTTERQIDPAFFVILVGR